jgi:hypothetical protein
MDKASKIFGGVQVIIAKPPGAQKHRIPNHFQLWYIPGFIYKITVFGHNLLVIGYTIHNAFFHRNLLLKV